MTSALQRKLNLKTSTRAPSDLEPPVFNMSGVELRSQFTAAIADEVGIDHVEASDSDLTDRYVQRSRVLGFPDTIVVRYFPRPGDRSTLALYSRSRFGRNDFGVNRQRLQRWLCKLKRHLDVRCL